MTRIQRRLLIDTSVIGIALTLFVAILDYSTQALKPLDDWFYDHRAQLCQYFTPRPTDKLVHVDIDDQALATLGQWPWPRAQFAEIIDEIDRAGAKAISMDIIFSEPSNPSPRIEETAPGEYVKIDDDAIFASALRRSGKCLVPLSLGNYQNPSDVYRKLSDYLNQNLELNEADCYQWLLADPGKVLPMGSTFPIDIFLTARRQAMNQRISAEMDKGEISREELRRRLLPKSDPEFTGSPLLRLLAEEHNKVLAQAPLKRFLRAIPPGLPPLAKSGSELAPIRPFSEAAAISGYVDYLQTSVSGVVRAIPLWADYHGKLFPQTDLALACAFLGVDINLVQLYPDKVVIPMPPGGARDVVIPVRNIIAPQLNQEFGMFMDVPDRGTAAWEFIYDHGHFKLPKLHLPIAALWEPHMFRERIVRNNISIDRAISTILDDDQPHKLALDPAKAKQYAAKRPPPEDTAARREFVEWTRGQLKESGFLELTKLTDAELKDKPDQRLQRDELIIANNALSSLLDQNKRFEEQIVDRRAKLRDQINGRAVMIGWVATGKTDFFPTAIHPATPGVVIHGMIFNAIMTYAFWYHAPAWVTALITIFIGLLITAANGFLKPSLALLAAVLLGAIYLFINGLVLFDYGHTCVGVAGPIVALASVWSTGTLASFLIESRERARITQRFSSYNDPKLVNHFIENPDTKLDGQVREMSVIFTDLAGFTTLSERLGERTVPILSRYFSVMVPVIRRNNGLVNKFLGDGIMCFYNAPDDDPDHAAHAVQTALEMQGAMKQFADELVAEGLPRVSMRCGVSTGTMVVGDSGPAESCDYTVLGDTVNFASRLEGANKAVGTNILISHRTTELLGDSRFLLRPVGKLLVVGKSEGVMTYEPLAPFDDATPQDMILATMGTEMIAAYFAKDFEKCIEFADKMDAQLGPTKLPGLYRKAALKYIETPPGPEFQGNLILTEK
ncbi:MAG: hypothetical protein JWN40_5841 [Phycisphaerales bacterium]|nr:hypothetical protein [Phycisphaerales bacterium]